MAGCERKARPDNRLSVIVDSMPRELGYESRVKPRVSRLLGLRQQVDPPSRRVRMIAGMGITCTFWGSAGLPGGLLLLVIGLVIASLAVVPIAMWEFSGRHLPLPAGRFPRLRGGLWTVLIYLIACIGFATGGTALVAETLLRPAWLPFAEYHYAQRPASAPVPSMLVVGPYVILNPTITPLGIRGSVPGGGMIAITWSESDGYDLDFRAIGARSGIRDG